MLSKKNADEIQKFSKVKYLDFKRIWKKNPWLVL